MHLALLNMSELPVPLCCDLDIGLQYVWAPSQWAIPNSRRHQLNRPDNCRFGGASRSGMAGPPRAVEVALRVSLKDLYTGTTKKIKITRRVADPADPTRTKSEEEVLEIKVQPGWKPGTRVTFTGKGDHLPGRPAQVSLLLVQSRQLRACASCQEAPSATVTTMCCGRNAFPCLKQLQSVQMLVPERLSVFIWKTHCPLCTLTRLLNGMQDVVFVIQQSPDPLFDREGDDLILHVAIYSTLALCESKIDVPTLDGRTLRVPLKEVCPQNVKCKGAVVQLEGVATPGAQGG